MHALAPAAATWPAAQAVHALAPAAANCPAVQTVQDAEPLSAANWPAEQAAQALAPLSALCWPASHAVQDAAPAPEYAPARHAAQPLLAPVPLNLPPGQVLQVAGASQLYSWQSSHHSFWYEPSLQSVQLFDSQFGEHLWPSTQLSPSSGRVALLGMLMAVGAPPRRRALEQMKIDITWIIVSE